MHLESEIHSTGRVEPLRDGDRVDVCLPSDSLRVLADTTR
jgi:hypothetical protein